MTQVSDPKEQRARGHRLIIIFAVAAVILGGSLVFAELRIHSLDHKADAATSDLRSKWRSIDLAGLSQAYAQATTAANDTGDYSAALRLFPTSDEATFVSAQFGNRGVVSAEYSVDAWAGSHECLGLIAEGTPPNRVTFVRGASGC